MDDTECVDCCVVWPIDGLDSGRKIDMLARLCWLEDKGTLGGWVWWRVCCKTKGQLAPSTMITFSRRPFQLAALSLAPHQFGRDTMTPRPALHAPAGANCIGPAQKAVTASCFGSGKKLLLKFVHFSVIFTYTQRCLRAH